jgi:pimeloyl-ACP methyl ester carboxylesterase
MISFGPFHLSASGRLLLRNEMPLDIGSRSLDILIALVERAGDVARIRARPAGLLGRLGIRRTNLLGASLGGYLARNFVLLHSDNVAQLVIANGFIDVVAFTITLPPASTGAAMDAAGIVQQTLRALFFVPTRSEGDVRLKRAVKALFGLAQILENYKSHVLLIMVGSHQRISNPG